jgi:hypothetical protein
MSNINSENTYVACEVELFNSPSNIKVILVHCLNECIQKFSYGIRDPYYFVSEQIFLNRNGSF